MNIVLGSTSPLKKRALENACRTLGINAEIICEPVTSGVNAQPVGILETKRGAQNRAFTARQRHPDALCVAVENGIRKKYTGWLDWAVVVVMAKNLPREIVLHSAPVAFPKEDVAAAKRLGFETTTVGSVIAKRTGCDADDPHAFLTKNKKTRDKILTETLILALQLALSEIPKKGRN